MSECPNCGAQLLMQKPLWPIWPFTLIKARFLCPVCDWEMSFEEVNRRGGLHRIKHEKIHGLEHRNSHHKHRHRRHRY